MHERDDRGEERGLTRSEPGGQLVRYAKWGLMGIGALVVVKTAASILLNPLLLIGGLVVGGAAWWALRSRRGGVSTEATAPRPVRALTAVSRDVVVEAALVEADRELDALLGAEVLVDEVEAARPPPAVATRTVADDPERLRQQLAALKARVRDEGGSGR